MTSPYANIDLSSEAGRREIGRILGEISRAEFQAGRPLLSAIVVSVEQDIPGEGFFDLARELCLYRRGQDKDEFQMGEMNRVHDYWTGR